MADSLDSLYSQLQQVEEIDLGDKASFRKMYGSDEGLKNLHTSLSQVESIDLGDYESFKKMYSQPAPVEKNIFQKAWGAFTEPFNEHHVETPSTFSTKGQTSPQSSFFGKLADNLQSGHGIFGASAAELAADAKWRKKQEEVINGKGDIKRNIDDIEKGIKTPTKFTGPGKDQLPERIIKASMLGSFGNVEVKTTPNSKEGEPDIINVIPKDPNTAPEVARVYKESTDLLSKMGYGRQADGSFKKISDSTISTEEYESYIENLNKNIKAASTKLLENDAVLQTEKNLGTKNTLAAVLFQPFGWEKWLFGKANSNEAIKTANDLTQLSQELTASAQDKKASQAVAPLQEEQSKAFLREEYVDPKTKTLDYEGWNAGIDEAINTAKEFRTKLASPETKKSLEAFGIDMAYAGDAKNKALLMQKFNYINPDKSFSNWLKSVAKADPGILGTIGGTIDFLTNGEMSSLDKEAMYIAGITPYKQQFEATGKQLQDQIKANDEQINKIIEQQSNLKPGYVVSPEGKKQLEDLQNTNIHLHTALDENQATVDVINDNIINNTKQLTKQEATTKWLEDKYNTAGILNNVPLVGQVRYGQATEATGYFVRGVTALPGNVGSLLKNLGAISTGNQFKAAQVLPSQNAIYDYTPEALTKSIGDAIKYEPGKGVSYDGVGLWYSTLKTATESMMLGVGGMATEGLGAKVFGEVAAKEAAQFEVATAYNSLAKQYAKQGFINLARGAEIAGKKGASWALEGALGYVTPSVLMFGNEMIDNELQKGLSLEEATKVGMMRAAIEGLTEKLNPLEMNMVKSLFVKGEIKNIGESLIFKELLRDKLGLSPRVFDFLYSVGQFAGKSTKQGFYETVEEEVGLWMNDQLTRNIQKGNQTYTNDEPFNGQNIINTALVTMATMAPMSVQHGYTEAKQNLKSLQYSRFVVGSNPSLYTPIIAQQLQQGKITNEQALTSLQAVSRLNAAFNQAEPDLAYISKATNMSGGEKKEAQTEIFNKHLNLLEKASEIEALLPEVKEAKLEELAKINDELKAYRDAVKIEDEAQRDAQDVLFAHEEIAVEEINKFYNPNKLLKITDIEAHKENLDYVNSELEQLFDMPDSERHDDILESYAVIKHNLEARIMGLEQNKETQIVDGKYIKVDPFKKSAEGAIDAEDIAAVENVPLATAQKMAELQDLIKDRGFSVFSGQGRFGLTDPEGTVIHQEPTIEALESYIKLLELAPESTGDLETKAEVKKQYEVGETVELSPTISSEQPTVEETEEEEKEQEEPIIYNDGSKSGNVVDIHDVNTDGVYVESTEAQVAANNAGDVARLGSIEGTSRIDGNIIYDGDKLVYVPTLAAYEARPKKEVEYTDAAGRVHERIVDESNLLNEDYLRLHTNDIKPGVPVIIRVKEIEQSRFVKESKQRFKETINEREAIGKLTRAQQLEDLDQDDNFKEIEVYDESGKFLFNLHTLAYIRPSRVATTTDTEDNNILAQYNALKEFRQAIIGLHNDLKDAGKPTDISTTIAGKSTGKLSVEMNNEYALVGRRFTNPAVLASLSLAPTARPLIFRGLQSSNIQPPGSVGVLIPTPNGQHFALQLSPQTLNDAAVNSIVTSIKLVIEYRSLLNVLNKTSDQQAKLYALGRVIDKASVESGFNFQTIEGLRNYISSFTHVKAKSSHFIQGAEASYLKDIPFIDFDVEQEKITFSRARNFDVNVDINELEEPTEAQAKSKQEQYRTMGVRRINMFMKTSNGKVSNPELTAFLEDFRQYLKGRRFNFDKDRQEDTTEFSLPMFTTLGTGAGSSYHLMSDSEKEKAGIAPSYKNYKDFIRSNVTTNVLEHKIEDKDGNTHYVYFEQPNIALSPVLNEVAPKKEEVHELYKGLKVVNDTNLKASTGEPGGAQFNRSTKQITINRPSLQQKFDEKAWTKPRTQRDGSQATALAENTFTTYQDWENFVMEHEFQHSVVSRQEFDALPENDGKQTTTGEYEDFINNAALAQLPASAEQKKKAIEDIKVGIDDLIKQSTEIADSIQNGIESLGLSGNQVKTIVDFFKQFGITLTNNESLQLALDLPLKQANFTNLEDLSEVTAAYLTEMLSYSGYFYRLREQFKDTEYYKTKHAEYKAAHPDEKDKFNSHRQVSKDIIRELLKNKFNERLLDKSILDRLKDLINEFLNLLKGANFAKIEEELNTIADQVFEGKDFIRVTTKKGYSQVNFQEAVDSTPFAKEVLTKLITQKGVTLTGSLAFAPQGTVYRKSGAQIHDIDLVLDFPAAESEALLRKSYPDAVKVYSFRKDYNINTFVIAPNGYEIKNVKTRPEGGNKVIGYDVVNKKTGKVEGTYKLNYTVDSEGKITDGEEDRTGVDSTFIDLFTDDTRPRESFQYEFEGSDGKKHKANLSKFQYPFKAKLEMSRLKDIWDYNRFIPNAEQPNQNTELKSITPKVNIINYRTMDDKSKEDAMNGVEEAQKRWVEEEIAEFYEAVEQYNKGLDTFSSKGVNKGKASMDDVIDETLGIFRTIQMFPKFSDSILPYLDDIKIALNTFGRKEGYAIYKAKKDAKGQAKEMTYENLFETVDKYLSDLLPESTKTSDQANIDDIEKRYQEDLEALEKSTPITEKESEGDQSIVGKYEYEYLPVGWPADGVDSELFYGTKEEIIKIINDKYKTELEALETKTSDQTETTEEIRKAQEKDVSSQKDEKIDDDWASLAPVREQQIPITTTVKFGDLTKQVENKCK